MRSSSSHRRPVRPTPVTWKQLASARRPLLHDDTSGAHVESPGQQSGYRPVGASAPRWRHDTDFQEIAVQTGNDSPTGAWLDVNAQEQVRAVPAKPSHGSAGDEAANQVLVALHQDGQRKQRDHCEHR